MTHIRHQIIHFILNLQIPNGEINNRWVLFNREIILCEATNMEDQVFGVTRDLKFF